MLICSCQPYRGSRSWDASKAPSGFATASQPLSPIQAVERMRVFTHSQSTTWTTPAETKHGSFGPFFDDQLALSELTSRSCLQCDERSAGMETRFKPSPLDSEGPKTGKEEACLGLLLGHPPVLATNLADIAPSTQ